MREANILEELEGERANILDLEGERASNILEGERAEQENLEALRSIDGAAEEI